MQKVDYKCLGLDLLDIGKKLISVFVNYVGDKARKDETQACCTEGIDEGKSVFV